MKLLSLIATCLLCLNSNAQKQYLINWKNTPLNTAPVALTANHYRLTGNVKSVEEINTFDTLKYEFDKNGFISLYKTSNKTYKSTTKYNYNIPGKIIEVTMNYNGRPESQKIYLDAAGRVIKSVYKSTPATYTEHEYNSKGLLYKIYVSAARTLSAVFEYNEDGQVIKEKHYIDGEVDTEIEPTYLRINKQLQTISYIRFVKDNEKATESNLFDENGKPVKFSDTETTITYTYQLDGNGNWISRTRTEKQNANSTTKSSVVTRKITYY